MKSNENAKEKKENTQQPVTVTVTNKYMPCIDDV